MMLFLVTFVFNVVSAIGFLPHQRLRSFKVPFDGDILTSLKYYETVQTTSAKSADAIYIDFNAFDEQFSLQLKPIASTVKRDILPDNTAIFTASNNYSSPQRVVLNVTNVKQNYLMGFCLKHQHEAHGYIKRTSGIFDGVIHLKNGSDVLYLEPAEFYFYGEEYKKMTLIYKAFDFIPPDQDGATSQMKPHFDKYRYRVAPLESRYLSK